MKLSTKGRYGLSAMIDLAVYSENEAVSLNSIAERQHISEGYLEQLMAKLKKAGLVESGVDAKFVIQDGLVTVNGEVETQRGKKLHGGELVSYNGETVKIVR